MKWVKSSLAPDSGKTNPTLCRVAGASGHKAPSVYVTGREEIEKLDTSRFLDEFGPQLPPSKLRKIRGRTLFTVHGYDDTDAPIFEIEEVRLFYEHLGDVWPCWTFAASLLCPCFWALALCSLPNLSVRRTANGCDVRVPRRDITGFMVASFPATVLLLRRAGFTQQSGTRRVEEVAKYFGVGDM